jgi:hypothetical protein
MNDTKIEICGMYENVSKTGNTYFVGYLGKTKLVMLKNPHAKDHDPTWTLFLAEREVKQQSIPS